MQARRYGVGGAPTLFTRRNIGPGASPWRMGARSVAPVTAPPGGRETPGRSGAVRRRGETPAPIFGRRANAAGAGRIETARATRPRRIHAETFVADPRAWIERADRAARPRG